VTKAMVLLKMAGQPFEHKRGDLRRAPKGKIPYIVDEGVTVADTTFIRAHLKKKYAVDFDAGLDSGARAIAWAFEKMMEEQFYFALLHSRWIDDASFDRGPREFFKMVPAPIRPLVVRAIRRKVRRQLGAQGMSRHSPTEVIELSRRTLDALSAHLADKPYLMGARPCGPDAGVFGQLAGAVTPHFENG
jgi:glutathione S-transferase